MNLDTGARGEAKDVTASLPFASWILEILRDILRPRVLVLLGLKGFLDDRRNRPVRQLVERTFSGVRLGEASCDPPRRGTPWLWVDFRVPGMGHQTPRWLRHEARAVAAAHRKGANREQSGSLAGGVRRVQGAPRTALAVTARISSRVTMRAWPDAAVSFKPRTPRRRA